MKNYFVYHLLIWLAFWIVPLILNHRIMLDSGIFWVWAHNISIIVLSSACTSFLNYYFLIYFFDKKKYFIYVLSIFTLVLIAFLTMGYFLMPISAIEKIKMSEPSIPHLGSLVVTIILSTLFRFAQRGIQKENEFKEASQKRTEMELKLLQMQLQPHFLFNSLNNLYATNLSNQHKANEMILQLADLLRYQLEIGKREKINLLEEITFTENYIALEKIRLSNCELSIEKEGNFDNFQIPPLLLLPLVENAFKHSQDIKKQFVKITFIQKDNIFTFICQNSIAKDILQKKSNKIGLENVKKRLEILYENQHTFSTEHTENVFFVFLEIKF